MNPASASPIAFDTLLPWLCAAWASVGIAALLFFRHSRNGRRKRVVWAMLMIGGNLAFIAVAWLVGAPWLLVAAAAVIALLGARRSITTARFCDACGGHHLPMDGAAPPPHCRHCGTHFDAPVRTPTVR